MGSRSSACGDSDARGTLIALHRAGGTPQKRAGVDPVKKNEGVRLDVIAAAVAAT